ncbi:RNA polymerase II subunit 5-mediating protein homolog isoform X1 [Amborella trichopoda]|uniref:RNA polymerase II subunit 5-mediating protein homolog isoform X1 n=1 Tax=Amborella trichopoda TaxID=13333 RepID=UPI0005D3275F|nr:RNA polymerase II subunit 5-mediating protein homolog isoform X1 [Amborella trichopoda]|eukprot:XP_011626664.1 RNA polymerase II subunit 5-mediating protein homolog isoform X1 [Amborella trichopoda]
MERGSKGTVTSLSSLFPVEEAMKAELRVKEAIAQRTKELDQLNLFISENSSLMNLVQRLPDEISHEIMVPFGKVAFFPGRLIHTNEFLVLLGDGYYAERSSKQTSEILHRRAKTLESKVEGLKAMLLDLEAEASFFNATAAEAAEGLFEIREDYIEQSTNIATQNQTGALESNADPSSRTSGNRSSEDEEYARMMLRLDELELEEARADENASGIEEEELPDLDDETSARCSGDEGEDIKNQPHKQDESIEGNVIKSLGMPSNVKMEEYFPRLEEKISMRTTTKGEVFKDNFSSHSSGDRAADNLGSHSSGDRAANRKAFTGLIVERDFSSNEGQTFSQAPSTDSPKPVSRFKMQRGNR